MLLFAVAVALLFKITNWLSKTSSTAVSSGIPDPNTIFPISMPLVVVFAGSVKTLDPLVTLTEIVDLVIADNEVLGWYFISIFLEVLILT